jgi:two-component system phosphate regulon response regulator PhoB
LLRYARNDSLADFLRIHQNWSLKMAKEKILVVDDEEDILELVRYNLSREGYQVTGSLTGEDALHKVRSEPFDLIVLDLMLPGMDGLAFTKTLKNDSRLRSIPIIMLTAKGEEADIVTGLELGADDYITKPFSPKVMIARVRTALRRHKEEPEDEMAIVKIHDLEINPGRRSVLAKDDPIDFTAGRQLVCIQGHAPIFSGPDRHRPQSQSRSSG